MLSLLDHDALRPLPQDPPPGPMDIPVSTQLSGLTVVHHEDVHPGQEAEQRRLLALDPVVHGIAHHQLGLLHLFQNAELKLGIDVAEEEKTSRTEGVGQPRLKLGEHSEPGLQRLPALQIVGVFPLPAKALSRSALHTGPVNATRREPLQLVLGVILTDDSDYLHRMEDGTGDAEVHRRSAQRVGSLAERSKNRIQCDAAYHQQGHGVTSDPGLRCRAESNRSPAQSGRHG
jgi:hypothetical protein